MDKTYRVITARLRVQRGPGKEDLVVERPFAVDKKTDSKVFADSDKEPTLVTFDKFCQVDIESLLRRGAIVEVAG